MPRRSQHDREYCELGRRIKDLRKSRMWTQVELAEYAGLNSGYVAEVERGGRNPSLETILNIAATLNVSAGYLVDGMRYETPAGMEKLAELWMSLDRNRQRALVQMASLLAADKSAPRKRSSSVGKRRA